MLNNPRRNAANILLARIILVLVVALAFVMGYVAGSDVTPNVLSALRTPAQRAAEQEEEPEAFDVFWEAWILVEEGYYYDLPEETRRTYGAIAGMLTTLEDPYTNFIPPEAAALMLEDETGEFEGIGAYVNWDEQGGVLIVRPFEGSPAAEAGLQPDDVIIAVDGTSIVELGIDQALLLIRGPADSEVTLTIRRPGEEEPFDVQVTRSRIEVPTVEMRMLDEQIGYVVLFEFNQSASQRLEEALDDLIDQGAQAIILDLRDNPGGFLDQAIEVSDLFLPKGNVLIQRDVNGRTRSHDSDNGDLAENIPLAVLINGGSASASEIVAGAIQDTGRGVLIGEQSFGKGSVQQQYNLSDGSLLRVTYAAWFTPNDRAINDEGIPPDIEVIQSPEDETDMQLEAAQDYLHENLEGKTQ